MSYKCSVCEQVKRKSALTFLEAIDDWICKKCLQKGREHGVSDLEDGKELTKKIREGEL